MIMLLISNLQANLNTLAVMYKSRKYKTSQHYDSMLHVLGIGLLEHNKTQK